MPLDLRFEVYGDFPDEPGRIGEFVLLVKAFVAWPRDTKRNVDTVYWQKRDGGFA